jgi:glycine/D-amino acid oxidase-like deaminating enzyme
MTLPYWLAEASAWRARTPEPTSTETTRVDVDVEVVGGGVTGCSCALALAERGLRVRVHEARGVAGGASGRNGGFALRGSADPYDRVREELGVTRAQLLWAMTEEALEQMQGLAGDALRPVGSLRLSADEPERERLAREFDALCEDGFDAEWIDALPAPLDQRFTGAILHPRDAAIDPARWVRRLARRAIDHGAEIVEGARVALDALDAPALVVAVDASIADLLAELAHVVRPVRGQMLATEPIPRRLFERPHYARNGFDYWQQLPDGRLLVGGRRDVDLDAEYTAVEETTDAIQSELQRLVIELAGDLPAVTHRWAGVWGETPDRLPLVGQVPGRENVWVAGGYSGHGNVLGFACGELVARAIAGETLPELELFDPRRFGGAEGESG